MAWYNRLLNVARPARLARDIEREMAFHVAERADELRAQGMSEAEALREAKRRFGHRTSLRERTHGQDVVVWLESVLADVRYALRTLRWSPGFAAVAILSLGLGIGATTAMFTLIDAVILRSLPVSHPQELVQVTMGGENGGNTTFTNPLWEAVRSRASGALSGAAAWSTEEFDLATGGEARRVTGYLVSGDFFAMLGVAPAAGRLCCARTTRAAARRWRC
jgi:putative ABC transport system permease protein